MSHTDHDDTVSADMGGAELPPNQARPMAGPTLIARSRQSAWPLFVLAPASALLVWMTSQTWSPSFHAEGRIAYLNDVPAGVRAAFFLGCALICIGCTGIVLWRRLWPRPAGYPLRQAEPDSGPSCPLQSGCPCRRQRGRSVPGCTQARPRRRSRTNISRLWHCAGPLCEFRMQRPTRGMAIRDLRRALAARERRTRRRGRCLPSSMRWISNRHPLDGKKAKPLQSGRRG